MKAARTLICLAGAVSLLSRSGTVHAEADSFGLGSGRDGPLSVTAANTSINSYASLTANAAASASVLSVDSVTGFAVGNLVLIWQTTGLAASEAPNGVQTPISLAGKNTGHYELARIEAVSSGSLTLTNPIMFSYRAGTAQVIRVPEYTTVTVSAAGSLVPGQRWDGSKGGVVAFLATGSITNNGVISADGAGFRGGVLVNHGALDNCNATVMGVPADGTPAMGYSPKGEGLVPGAYTPMTGGRANVANGGGGGVCHNSGGGGGGHAGPGGLGGRTWMGDGMGRFLGGYGGAALVYDPLSLLSFGGGGGSGDQNNNVGTAGGRGGGLVFIRGGSLLGSGVIRANGEKPTRAGEQPAANDGAGGGGAGGAIVLRLAGSATCTSIQANGGGGGDVQFGSNPNTDPHGPGGGGGGGLIYFERAAGGTCPTSVEAGVAGRWNGTLFHGATPNSSTHAAHIGTVTAVSVGYSGAPCTSAQIAAGSCGGCVFASECGGAAPVCVLAGNTCAACSANFGAGGAACPDSAQPVCLLSGPNQGSCVECSSNAHCAGNSNGPLCDTSKNTCGVCTASDVSACTGTTPACNRTPTHNVCAACNGDFGSGAGLACPMMAAPYCLTMGTSAGACVACRDSGDCGGTTPICGAMNATCEPCGADFGASAPNACPSASAPFCAIGVGSCSNVCMLDVQCGAGNWCNSGTCQPKVPNGQPVPGGVCMAALAARACVSGVCDPSDDRCGIRYGGTGCTATSQCRTGLCILSGANQGACLDCNVDTDCAGATPVCHTNNRCVACGPMNSRQCVGLSPVCDLASGACTACDGDAGSGQPAACPSVSPHCFADGSCGRCSTNADCMVGTRSGPICNTGTGACGSMCSDDRDCASSHYCDNPSAMPYTGTCTPKLPNGAPIPSSPPFAGMCSGPIAERVCASGACEPIDDRCGLRNDSPCTRGASCRSEVCHDDGRCGLPNGAACQASASCRSEVCHDDGRCGLPVGEICSSATQCRSDRCVLDRCMGDTPDAGASDADVREGGAPDGDWQDGASNSDGASDSSGSAGAGGAGGAGGTGGAGGVDGVGDAGDDSGGHADAGVNPDGPTEALRIGGGGCSCELGGESREDAWLPLLLGVVVVLLRRRCNRRS